jgi:hypothetical protein
MQRRSFMSLPHRFPIAQLINMDRSNARRECHHESCWWIGDVEQLPVGQRLRRPMQTTFLRYTLAWWKRDIAIYMQRRSFMSLPHRSSVIMRAVGGSEMWNSCQSASVSGASWTDSGTVRLGIAAIHIYPTNDLSNEEIKPLPASTAAVLRRRYGTSEMWNSCQSASVSGASWTDSGTVRLGIDEEGS